MTLARTQLPGRWTGFYPGRTRRCPVVFPTVLSGNRGAVRHMVDTHTDDTQAVRAARFSSQSTGKR